VSVAGGHSRETDRKRAKGDARTRDHSTETAWGWACSQIRGWREPEKRSEKAGEEALLTSWRLAICWL
jgi:hypothetical protein